MILAFTILFLSALVVYAYTEAKVDAERIVRHQAIDHGAELKDRLAICAGIWGIFTGLMFIATGQIFPALLWVPMGWAAFTIAFRLFLNRMRGLDWRYISPSNVYDWLFIGADLCFQFKFHWAFHKRKMAIRVHSAYFEPNSLVWQEYVQHTHRAGTFAYTFECLVFLASAAGLWWWA